MRKKASTKIPAPAGRWVKKPAILREYSVKRRTLERWMEDGLVPYLKLGSAKQSPVFFDPAAVEAALMKFNRGVAAR